ncbi:Uncharacterized protein Adt_21261 [Abeliophyllum distichum]|uniref:Reverse transcriptase/retrotransposon-derived protein RNase H-like domain-containing protein n=1 Tax=Abeliophyllum distichum TaxID=126358 RepID=A0ABD1SYY8_9LAMI
MFKWTTEHEAAFQALKKYPQLCSSTIKAKDRRGFTALLSSLLRVSKLGPDLKRRARTACLLCDAKARSLRRLLKSAVELNQFDIIFKPRVAIKRQALTDFVAEFANTPEVDALMAPLELPTWCLFLKLAR